MAKHPFCTRNLRSTMSKTRRNFIKNAGTVGAAAALGGLDVARASAKKRSSEARCTVPELHCIVTGRNKAGKSVIVSKDAVNAVSAALAPGYEFYRLWGSDSVPALPSDGTPPAQPQYFPQKNCFRFGMFTLPPAATAAIAPAATPANIAEFNHKLPGVCGRLVTTIKRNQTLLRLQPLTYTLRSAPMRENAITERSGARNLTPGPLGV